MNRLYASLALLLLALMATVTSNAQATIPPIVIVYQGDLWAWEGADLRQLTQYGYNSGVAVSPDGRYAVYLSVPQVVVDAYERAGGFISGRRANSVRLYDLATGEDQRIAGEPEPAYFLDETQPDNVLARSQPVWSPDGRYIAWTDFFFSDARLQLGIYELASNTYQSLNVDLPMQYGVPSPRRVMWTHSGVIIDSASVDDLGEVGELRLYNTDGTLLSITSYTPPLRDAVLLHHQGRDYYAQRDFAANIWVITDLLTANQFASDAILELRNPITTPMSSFFTIPTITERASSDGTLIGRMFADGYDSQSVQLARSLFTGRMDIEGAYFIFLSPDGQGLAYQVYNNASVRFEETVQINYAGETYRFTTPNDGFLRGISWSTQFWYLPDDAILTPIAPREFSCPTALAPRLIIGEDAIVLGDTPNRVRNAPDGEVIGNIPSGATFTVIGHPTCDADVVWWLIDYQGLVGWTAEGTDTYFVEPVTP